MRKKSPSGTVSSNLLNEKFRLNVPFIGRFWQNPFMKNYLPSNWPYDHQHTNMPSHTSGALSLGANVLKEHTPRIIPRAAVEQPANGCAKSFAVGVGGGT